MHPHAPSRPIDPSGWRSHDPKRTAGCCNFSLTAVFWTAQTALTVHISSQAIDASMSRQRVALLGPSPWHTSQRLASDLIASQRNH